MLPLDQNTFDGVTVVDFTRLLPGPFATMLLADLGARVIKIEAPQGGDYARWTPPVINRHEAGYGALFQAVNRGKESVAANLKDPRGVEFVRQIVARADVVIESFRPGVLDRIGLDLATMSRENPKLIVCRISGYGQTGPMAKAAGHDINYMALAGALGLTGPVDGVPQIPAVQVADLAGGALYSAFGIAAALYRRERTGRGAELDISMTEGVLSLLGPAVGAAAISGRTPARGGDILSGGLPCYRCYETADSRYLAVGALEPKFWMAFCTAAGRPEWLGDALLSGADAEAAMERIAAGIREKTLAEWMEVLDGVDACVEPVKTLDEIVADALHVTRAAVRELPDGGVGTVPPTSPKAVPLGSVPLLGEHTAALAAELNMPAEELESLAAAGVLSIPAAP